MTSKHRNCSFEENNAVEKGDRSTKQGPNAGIMPFYLCAKTTRNYREIFVYIIHLGRNVKTTYLIRKYLTSHEVRDEAETNILGSI